MPPSRCRRPSSRSTAFHCPHHPPRRPLERRNASRVSNLRPCLSRTRTTRPWTTTGSCCSNDRSYKVPLLSFLVSMVSLTHEQTRMHISTTCRRLFTDNIIYRFRSMTSWMSIRACSVRWTQSWMGRTHGWWVQEDGLRASLVGQRTMVRGVCCGLNRTDVVASLDDDHRTAHSRASHSHRRIQNVTW